MFTYTGKLTFFSFFEWRAWAPSVKLGGTTWISAAANPETMCGPMHQLHSRMPFLLTEHQSLPSVSHSGVNGSYLTLCYRAGPASLAPPLTARLWLQSQRKSNNKTVERVVRKLYIYHLIKRSTSRELVPKHWLRVYLSNTRMLR